MGNDASLMPLGGGFQGAGIPFIYSSRPSAFLFPPGGPQAEKCSEQTQATPKGSRAGLAPGQGHQVCQQHQVGSLEQLEPLSSPGSCPALSLPMGAELATHSYPAWRRGQWLLPTQSWKEPLSPRGQASRQNLYKVARL